jgi:pimeloyl-ACP methyl ester carboxylesterase
MFKHEIDLARRGLLGFAGAGAAAAAVASMPSIGRAATSTRPARLFHTDTGSGPDIMLIHGWACDSHDWSWQLPMLESRYRVVAVDLRGHGRSEVMPAGYYRPKDYVADIEHLIETKLVRRRFVLVGHSMGGQVAARLALQRPDLVEAVVSVDGALGLAEEAAPLFQQVTSDLRTSDPGVVGPALFAKVYDPATDPAMKRWHARRLQGSPEVAVRESFGPLFVGSGQVGIGNQSEAFIREIKVPFYHLSRDQTQVDRMRPWLSNSKSKVDHWAKAGHWIMQDRKDEVNRELVAWIDAL